MTRLLLILALSPLAVMTASGQPLSYWWSQMTRKPDAKTSQEFWFVPGTNMVFTYATNHVILNAGGGGGGGTTNNYYYTNNNYFTNTYYVTNTITITQSTGGLTITQSITDLLLGAITNVFSNGLLVASGPAAVHCSSLVLPGGGYLTQPGGSTLCLP